MAVIHYIQWPLAKCLLSRSRRKALYHAGAGNRRIWRSICDIYLWYVDYLPFLGVSDAAMHRAYRRSSDAGGEGHLSPSLYHSQAYTPQIRLKIRKGISKRKMSNYKLVRIYRQWLKTVCHCKPDINGAYPCDCGIHCSKCKDATPTFKEFRRKFENEKEN